MADDDFTVEAFRRAVGRRGARFAARERGRGGGMIFVVSGLEDKGLLQGDRGRFIGAGIQSDLAEANRRLAKELAQLTADTMQGTLVRPNVSSKRLREALLHENNRYSDQFGFGVGDAEWLDESPAKYWRQIDQGFTGHLDRVIHGVWGATLTGAYGGASSYGPYPIAGPAYTSFGLGKGGRLLPMGPLSAYKFLREHNGKKRLDKKPGVKGVIKKAIKPHRYFEKAWEEFDIKARYMRTVREIISRNFGGAGIPTAANLRFLSGQPGAKQPPPSRQFR